MHVIYGIMREVDRTTWVVYHGKVGMGGISSICISIIVIEVIISAGRT
jgi:hypothetical protein